MPRAYGSVRRCKTRRRMVTSPYPASATTAVRVSPAARTCRSSCAAKRHFSRNTVWAGIRAARRRAGSALHSRGRYRAAPTSHARTPVHNTAVTATWQLPIVPRVPLYWRATPTECVPFLGKPVSSRIKTPRRSGSCARRICHIRFADHGASVMKCWKV